MRLASALLSGLLLVASTALADPPASGQGAAAPQSGAIQAGPAAAAGPWQKDAGASQTPDPSQPHLSRTTYPEYGSVSAPGGQATESICYIIFGELRCDRRPIDAPSRTPR